MKALYHGTSRENAHSIKASGTINGPVYLTANYEQAVEYALNNDSCGVVITIDDIDTGITLQADNESCDWVDVDEALENDAEVFINDDLPIPNAQYTYYENYEEISGI